jgi:hypothetical protein
MEVSLHTKSVEGDRAVKSSLANDVLTASTAKVETIFLSRHMNKDF